MSKNYRLYLAAGVTLALLTSILISSCKLNTEVTSPQTTSSGTTTKASTISGQVINNITGIPIDSVYVQLTGTSVYLTALTDTQGKYSFTVNLSGNTSFTLISSKANYNQDTTLISVTAGVNYTVSLIKLIPTTSGSGQVPSGNPVSIFLASQTADNVGVKESGSPETAGITFEVQDSAGVAIDLAHSVNVKFSMGAHPGGGEFLSPSVVQTNDKGQATVNLTSGTTSGVVQIIAEIDKTNSVIKSKPVSIAIHGGLPDYAHFSIATTLVNIPSVVYKEYPSFVNVFIGDKYANPVKPQTAVYFTTTGGYVQGSALTDQLGVASAELIMAEPNDPIHPIFGAGFATITARTADENLETISKSTVVLFSGYPTISVSPTSFNIPNGGSQSFTYTVKDANNNPMAGGTNISVSVGGQNVAAQGDIAVLLPDTQDKTWTHFQFLVYDTVDTINVASPVTINIISNGPNGKASTIISGTSH